MGNWRYQRTAQMITSAVNCRPLNCSLRSPIAVLVWPPTAPILPAGQQRPNLATEPSFRGPPSMPARAPPARSATALQHLTQHHDRPPPPTAHRQAMLAAV